MAFGTIRIDAASLRGPAVNQPGTARARSAVPFSDCLRTAPVDTASDRPTSAQDAAADSDAVGSAPADANPAAADPLLAMLLSVGVPTASVGNTTSSAAEVRLGENGDDEALGGVPSGAAVGGPLLPSPFHPSGTLAADGGDSGVLAGADGGPHRSSAVAIASEPAPGRPGRAAGQTRAPAPFPQDPAATMASDPMVLPHAAAAYATSARPASLRDPAAGAAGPQSFSAADPSAAIDAAVPAPSDPAPAALAQPTDSHMGEPQAGSNSERAASTPDGIAVGAPEHVSAGGEPVASAPPSASVPAPAGPLFGGGAASDTRAPSVRLPDLHLGEAADAPWLDRLADDIRILASHDQREARLHLRPVELGELTIQIKVENRATQVHFTVETDAARMLLADAAPRLSALVEDRGLLLEQTSFALANNTDGRSGREPRGQLDGGSDQAPNRPVAGRAAAAEDLPPRILRRGLIERYA